MTVEEPNEAKWGYICVIIFVVFAIWGITEFVKLEHKKKPKDEEENDT